MLGTTFDGSQGSDWCSPETCVVDDFGSDPEAFSHPTYRSHRYPSRSRISARPCRSVPSSQGLPAPGCVCSSSCWPRRAFPDPAETALRICISGPAWRGGDSQAVVSDHSVL